MGVSTNGPLRETINILALGLSDYRKAYDMIPHSLIAKCLEMFEIVENCENVFFYLWYADIEVELSSSGERLEVVN